jgi:CelD/BcsL family acetyltransferase involved in cellulose biosynthesis
LSIKHAIEEGASEYDMLHGDEEYKFHWARSARHLIRLELHPPNGRGLLSLGARKVREVAGSVARRMLSRHTETSKSAPAARLWAGDIKGVHPDPRSL